MKPQRFSTADILKIQSFGGQYNPTTGEAKWANGSAITNPSQLESVNFGKMDFGLSDSLNSPVALGNPALENAVSGYAITDPASYITSGNAVADASVGLGPVVTPSTTTATLPSLDVDTGGSTNLWDDDVSDFTSKDFGNYASGIGAIGQLGLGALGYLDNKKTAEAQRNLLNQQYTTNEKLMSNYGADRQHTIDAFKAK